MNAQQNLLGISDPDAAFKSFKYEHEIFLRFEHTTSQKTMWALQNKVYLEILNAPDPKKAFLDFKKLGKTTHQIASERLGQ